MKILLTASLLILSQTLLATSIKFECKDERGSTHKLQFLDGPFRFDKHVLRLENSKKIKFSSEVEMVSNPIIYRLDNKGVIAEGNFGKHTFIKSKGTGLVSIKVRTHVLYMEESVLSGRDGKVHYTYDWRESSLLGSFFGGRSHSGMDIYDMDCVRIPE